jgi:hypothetical protein
MNARLGLDGGGQRYLAGQGISDDPRRFACSSSLAMRLFGPLIPAESVRTTEAQQEAHANPVRAELA